MKILVALLCESALWLLLTVPASPAELAATRPTGVSVMSPPGMLTADNKQSLKEKNISSVTVRAEMKVVKPSKTSGYNWSKVIAERDAVVKAGKQWEFELYTAGGHGAAWMGGDGAQNTEPYVQAIEAAWADFGRILGADKNLVCVHITTPSSGSAEWSRPTSNITSQPGWQKKVVDASFARTAIAIKTACPTAYVCYNLHNPTSSRDGFTKLATQKLQEVAGKGQAMFQFNSWKADSNPNYNPYQEVKQLSKDGWATGLEQVMDSQDSRYGGTTKKTAFAESMKVVEDINVDRITIYDFSGDAQRVQKPYAKK